MRVKKITALVVLVAGLNVALSSGQAFAADPRNGAKLYTTHCAGCHGPKGQGSMPGTPDFRRGQSLLVANAELVRVIEQGRGVMPAFRGLLTTQDILDVIAHLRTFQ